MYWTIFPPTLAYGQHLQGAAGCLHGIFTRVTYPLTPLSSSIPSIPTLPAHVPSLTRSFWHLHSVSCMGSSSLQILWPPQNLKSLKFFFFHATPNLPCLSLALSFQPKKECVDANIKKKNSSWPRTEWMARRGPIYRFTVLNRVNHEVIKQLIGVLLFDWNEGLACQCLNYH